jgi:hypothetical protein
MTAASDLAPVLRIERQLRLLTVEITQLKATSSCTATSPHAGIRLRRAAMAVRHRDLLARATALHSCLMSKGAGCDYEIFLSGWTLRRLLGRGTVF